MSSWIERTGKDIDHDLEGSSIPEPENDGSLYSQWIDAKEAERLAICERRAIEDKLISQIDINPQDEGSKTLDLEGYSVKVTTRLARKVDADALIELAANAGIDNEHLQALFRWKPEINLKEWQKASPEITEPLAQAITTKPGRPSFTIKTLEK